MFAAAKPDNGRWRAAIMDGTTTVWLSSRTYGREAEAIGAARTRLSMLAKGE